MFFPARTGHTRTSSIIKVKEREGDDGRFFALRLSKARKRHIRFGN